MGNAEPTREMSRPPLPPMPAAAPVEPTASAEPASSSAPLTMRDPIAEDAGKRAQVANDLAKMGLSPAEVRRLLDADPNEGLAAAPVALPPAALAAVSAARRSVPTSAPARTPPPAAPNFPEFRAVSPAETREAEPLLREASLLRRREKYADAETKCRAALNLVPKDAAALELLGDILQGVARVDEALAAYQRAAQADPKRASAEGKYADLLTRQQDYSHFDPEAATKNPMIATLLSCLLPGAGQFYNGDVTKALFFFLCDIVFGYLIAWSPWGFKSGHRGGGVSASLMTLAFLSAALYIASLIDALRSAKRGGAAGRSGWEL